MMDDEYLRNLMVERQLVARGISDPRVLEAMRAVPRHRFMPEYSRKNAYDDMALPIGQNQTISQPYMVAIMTELLRLSGSERVLEIGTGSGYQAAVLAHLAREVVTVERIPELAGTAQAALRELGYENVICILSDGTLGAPDHAPFDRILVTAGSPDVPIPLIDQLGEGGILVAPVGDRASQQIVQLIKSGGDIQKNYKTHCIFVPLIGRYGWNY